MIMSAPIRTAESTGSAAPDWFTRGRVLREVRAATETVAPQSDEVKTPFARFVAGYGSSFLVHLVLLAIFSLVAVSVGRGGPTLSTKLGVPDEVGEELLDTRTFEVAGGSDASEAVKPLVQPVPIAEEPVDLDLANPLAEEKPGESAGTGTDVATAQGQGEDEQTEVPGGGSNAVTVGSFTAWTIPEDPRPGQDYALVIELKLPEGTKTYRREDLTGLVRGSDGYLVRIPNGMEYNGQFWVRPRRLPAFRRTGDHARIMLFVRGAQRLVVDRIAVGSRLLDEQQQLEITF